MVQHFANELTNVMMNLPDNDDSTKVEKS
jgi:hypothetical protein